ncbi:MAG: urea transporter [Nitrospiraceae bacterium]
MERWVTAHQAPGWIEKKGVGLACLIKIDGREEMPGTGTARASNDRSAVPPTVLQTQVADSPNLRRGDPRWVVRVFGYNAALTAMALGGSFFVLNLSGFLYTVIGVLVTARVWASLGIFLEPAGMPVLTSAFVFITWLMLLAKNGFPVLIPVSPAEATTPEGNLQRYYTTQKR